MAFFDTKEEVVEIQLTQYGKSILSRGKFKPVFYAFYDDDILYDTTYAGLTEIQNATEDRIKNKTPRMRTQYVFAGIEENISQRTPAEGQKDEHGEAINKFGPGTFELQPQVQNEYALGVPLGQSSLTSQHAPAWEINYLHGEMASSLDYIAGSGLAYFQIPQLSSVVDYETYITTINESGELTKDHIPENLKNLVLEEEDPKELGVILEQGLGEAAGPRKIIQTKPDFLLLEALEHNADFWKENFDIEVFIIRKDTGENDEEIDVQQQLYFHDPVADLQVTPNHVEYYFNIYTDEEIPSRYFCAADIKESKKRNLISDGLRIMDCPDVKEARDLYQKKLEDIEEPC